VRTILTRLWTTAADPEPPPPLQHSPKCARCSLVGICLPDEVNALRTRADEPARPRRLMAADPDSRPVYVQEQGTVIGVRRGRLEAFKDGTLLGSYRLIDVSQLCLQGNTTITPQAMRELFTREIPVCWFSYGGWFAGMSQGLPGKNVDLRRAQYRLLFKTSDAKQATANRIAIKQRSQHDTNPLVKPYDYYEPFSRPQRPGSVAGARSAGPRIRRTHLFPAPAAGLRCGRGLDGFAEHRFAAFPGPSGRAPLRAGVHRDHPPDAVGLFPAPAAGLRCGPWMRIGMPLLVIFSRPQRPGSVAGGLRAATRRPTATSFSRPQRPGSVAGTRSTSGRPASVTLLFPAPAAGLRCGERSAVGQ
jgi:hypothetical protein